MAKIDQTSDRKIENARKADKSILFQIVLGFCLFIQIYIQFTLHYITLFKEFQVCQNVIVRAELQ